MPVLKPVDGSAVVYFKQVYNFDFGVFEEVESGYTPFSFGSWIAMMAV